MARFSRWGFGLVSGVTMAALAMALLATPRAQERTRLEPVLSDASRLALDWTLDGSGTWRMADGVLTLQTAGTPGGPIRRPSALALLNAGPFIEVTLALELQSTAALPAVTPRRDVLLIAGYQSPTRFYYAHISSVRDDVHNGIFVVDNADRRRIDDESSVAPLADQDWHLTRLEHDGRTGRLAVYFGERPAPIMTATDDTLPTGRVGVGSFDDTAAFRRIRVTGTLAP